MNPMISAERVREKQDGIVLLDARTGACARAAYLEEHIAGARFVDLESDLATPIDPAFGGRHPLPEARAFAARVGALGIDPSDEVVVYDTDAGTNAAARAWWMLRALGHRSVYVLDGGLAAAKEEGVLMASGDEVWVAKPAYPGGAYALPVVDLEQVARDVETGAVVLLDARAPARYRGEVEPIDPVAGHIPHARNLFHRDHLDVRGRLLSAQALRRQFEPFLKDERPLVASCGSGVTACHTILAAVAAGLPPPALYVGSWSEWCRSGRTYEPV